MTYSARSPVFSRGREVALAMLAAAAFAHIDVAVAQVAPIDHGGYVEYQLRTTRGEEGLGNDQHLATWRARASTFVWRPYILLLDGNLGLTRTRNLDSKSKNEGTIVTGAIAANAFARSTFPFRLYFQSRDSRIDGELFDTDFTTRNWGFLQRLASRRNGGSVSLEYRNSDTDEISVNGTTEQRKFGSELWQLTGNQAFGRNDFRLVTSARKLTRSVPAQSQDRILLSLRLWTKAVVIVLEVTEMPLLVGDVDVAPLEIAVDIVFELATGYSKAADRSRPSRGAGGRIR